MLRQMRRQTLKKVKKTDFDKYPDPWICFSTWSFPQKLFYLIDHCTNENLSEINVWFMSFGQSVECQNWCLFFDLIHFIGKGRNQNNLFGGFFQGH